MTNHHTLTSGTHRRVLFILVCMLVWSTFASTVFSQAPEKSEEKENTAEPAPLVIRVGAIYYDDDKAQFSTMNKVLSSLAKHDRDKKKESGQREIVFRLAVGTYDEVLEWYKTDQIDLAILNPGPIALLLDQYRNVIDQVFVGIRSRAPLEGSFAAGTNGIKSRVEYHSLMVLNSKVFEENPHVDAFQLVKDSASVHKAHFLFVHPFSTSGYIFPRTMLQDKLGLHLNSDDYEITYSHDVSVAEVEGAAYNKEGRLNVAFVSDETARTAAGNPNLKIVPLDQKIVQDALLLTPDFARKNPGEVDRIIKLLRAKGSKDEPTFDLEAPPDWKSRYEIVKSWITSFTDPQLLMSRALTLDQIIRRINNYNLHHDKPARLAIVLSGGGAKCAYQLGAVEAIEDKLADFQSAAQKHPLKIDLVVGTSGGAINALTVAAGATQKGSQKRESLAATWRNFGQSEILKPSNSVRRLIGVTLGFFLSLAFVFVCYARYKRNAGEETPADVEKNGIRSRIKRTLWFEKAGIILLIASLLLYLVGQIRVDIASLQILKVRFLLDNHNWIHFIEYGRQSVRWLALAMFICGVVLCLGNMRIPRSYVSQTTEVFRERRRLAVTLVVLVLMLPLIVDYTTLREQESLFLAEGIQHKMASEMPPVLNVCTSAGSACETLEQISRQVVQQGRIQRDLIITGSMLPQVMEGSALQTDEPNPTQQDKSDLYFLYRTDQTTPLPDKVLKDGRFVDLRTKENESILLDAVIGSGAIYPAFEPRKISSLKRLTDQTPIKDVLIIDGGFVHNSPIDAAVQLDATHIIVIEASPEDRPSQKRDFVSNAISAFNYLFNQAQLLDARSRREAEVFTLRPATPGENDTPYLCTLDFGKSFIEYAMGLGAADARRTMSPSFKRQPRPAALD